VIVTAGTSGWGHISLSLADQIARGFPEKPHIGLRVIVIEERRSPTYDEAG
jgi:hypothetical protein